MVYILKYSHTLIFVSQLTPIRTDPSVFDPHLQIKDIQINTKTQARKKAGFTRLSLHLVS